MLPFVEFKRGLRWPTSRGEIEMQESTENYNVQQPDNAGNVTTTETESDVTTHTTQYEAPAQNETDADSTQVGNDPADNADNNDGA
jgi:hypothetical protein